MDWESARRPPFRMPSVHQIIDVFRRLTTGRYYLAALVVIVVASVGIITIDPIFQMMGATPDLLPLIHDYMNIWYLGVGFIMVPIVGNNAMRATGDTKTPSLVIIVIGVVNAVLDPFLIFGIGPFPRMEVQGAALATVIAYSMAFFAALWFLGIRKKMLDFAIPQLVSVFRSWKQILHVGLPAAGTPNTHSSFNCNYHPYNRRFWS